MNNYFSHDSNARNSDRIINLRMKLGAEGYGIYFMILERLREEPEYMSIKDYNMIAFDFRVNTEKVKSVIEDFGLFVFTEDGKYFYSDSFKERMILKDGKSKKRSEAGVKGMNSRWKNERNITNTAECDNNVITKPTESITRKEKESKEKESKENTPPLTPPDGVEEKDRGGGNILISDLKKSLMSVTSLSKDDIWEGMRLSLNGDLNSYGGSTLKYWLEHQESNTYYTVIQSLQNLEQKGILKPKPMPHEDYFAYLYVYEKCLRTDAEKIKAMVSDPMCLSELKKLIAECKKGRIKTPGAFILSRLKQLKTPARQANQIAS